MTLDSPSTWDTFGWEGSFSPWELCLRSWESLPKGNCRIPPTHHAGCCLFRRGSWRGHRSIPHLQDAVNFSTLTYIPTLTSWHGPSSQPTGDKWGITSPHPIRRNCDHCREPGPIEFHSPQFFSRGLNQTANLCLKLESSVLFPAKVYCYCVTLVHFFHLCPFFRMGVWEGNSFWFLNLLWFCV